MSSQGLTHRAPRLTLAWLLMVTRDWLRLPWAVVLHIGLILLPDFAGTTPVRSILPAPNRMGPYLMYSQVRGKAIA